MKSFLYLDINFQKTITKSLFKLKLSNSGFKKYNIINLVDIKNTETNTTSFFV